PKFREIGKTRRSPNRLEAHFGVRYQPLRERRRTPPTARVESPCAGTLTRRPQPSSSARCQERGSWAARLFITSRLRRGQPNHGRQNVNGRTPSGGGRAIAAVSELGRPGRGRRLPRRHVRSISSSLHAGQGRYLCRLLLELDR